MDSGDEDSPLPDPSTVIVVCHTEGCIANGLKIPVTVRVEGDDEPDVICGQCNEEITDISDPDDDDDDDDDDGDSED